MNSNGHDPFTWEDVGKHSNLLLKVLVMGVVDAVFIIVWAWFVPFTHDALEHLLPAEFAGKAAIVNGLDWVLWLVPGLVVLVATVRDVIRVFQVALERKEAQRKP